LKESGRAETLARLIADDYLHRNVKPITSDKRMAKLTGVEFLD
jgi:hypothetical protein